MLANNLILEQLLMDRHQILVPILSEFKQIDQFLMRLKLSESLGFLMISNGTEVN